MNVRSSRIYERLDLLSIGLALVGLTTVVTSTAYLIHTARRSSSSAKTTSVSISLDGSQNSSPRLVTQEEWLGYSSTKSEERPTQQSSTQLSHSGCWCNSSKKRGTSNG